jgi:hypothetical protein
MLMLAGYVLQLGRRLDAPPEERLVEMQKGRTRLVRMTEHDFGYDLQQWERFLLDHEEEFGYSHPYGAAVVHRAIAEAVSDPIRLWLVGELGNPTRTTERETWLTPTVETLATTIYDQRAFDRLPILADALEEAGCTDADILSHCRQPGVHVRGCWVVDLILGKE